MHSLSHIQLFLNALISTTAAMLNKALFQKKPPSHICLQKKKKTEQNMKHKRTAEWKKVNPAAGKSVTLDAFDLPIFVIFCINVT